MIIIKDIDQVRDGGSIIVNAFLFNTILLDGDTSIKKHWETGEYIISPTPSFNPVPKVFIEQLETAIIEWIKKKEGYASKFINSIDDQKRMDYIKSEAHKYSEGKGA